LERKVWDTGVQEFRSSGVQEFRSSGVQEGEHQAKNKDSRLKSGQNGGFLLNSELLNSCTPELVVQSRRSAM
jgi:hypothetical protein